MEQGNININQSGQLIVSERDVSGTVSAKWAKHCGGPAGDECQHLVAHTLRGEGHDASCDGSGKGTPLVVEPFVLIERGSEGVASLEFRQDGTSNAVLTQNGSRRGFGVGAIAIQERAISLTESTSGPKGAGWQDDAAFTLEARHSVQAIAFPAFLGETACASAVDVSPCLGSINPTAVAYREVVPFDTTQITRPANRSPPKPGDAAPTLNVHAHPPCVAFTTKDHGQDAGVEIAPTLRAMNNLASHANGGGQVAVAVQNIGRCREQNGSGVGDPDGAMFTLDTASLHGVAVSVSENSNGFAWTSDLAPTLQSHSQSPASNQFDGVIDVTWAVRRITPRECERLQGFPDDFTAIQWRGGKVAADSPRYRAIGNSMAVNVMRWVGRRIDVVVRALAEHEASKHG